MYLCRPPGRLLPRVFWLSFLNNWPPSSHYSNWSLPTNPLSHRGTPYVSVPIAPLTIFHPIPFQFAWLCFPPLPLQPSLIPYCMTFSSRAGCCTRSCSSVVFTLLSFYVFFFPLCRSANKTLYHRSWCVLHDDFPNSQSQKLEKLSSTFWIANTIVLYWTPREPEFNI